jgi:hypothetical protein
MLVTLEKGLNFAAVLGGGRRFYTATELEGWGWAAITMTALTIKEATASCAKLAAGQAAI